MQCRHGKSQFPGVNVKYLPSLYYDGLTVHVATSLTSGWIFLAKFSMTPTLASAVATRVSTTVSWLKVRTWWSWYEIRDFLWPSKPKLEHLSFAAGWAEVNWNLRQMSAEALFSVWACRIGTPSRSDITRAT